MSFTSFVVGRDCFRKTSEMARVKSFDCQFENFEMEMSAMSYAVLSLSLCMMWILYLFPGPLLYQSLKKSLKFFSSVTFSLSIFHSANHDADSRPVCS